MKIEPTFKNASRRVNIAKYCYKYGNVEGIVEMVHHYHLRNDEAIYLIAKAYKFELITEYDILPIKDELGL